MKVIVTGVTGMVGEGVMHECLNHPEITEVLSISRKMPLTKHPRLKSLVHADMKDISSLENQVKGYDACFFCLGVSSVGMKEPEYTEKTFDLTIGFASTLQKVSPGMTFCYISGAATDSTEKGRSMWARVKGRTENELLQMFPSSYMFRPGYMQPTGGLHHALKYYKYIQWMYPALRAVFPGFVGTLAELGKAMINAARWGYQKRILEVRDIRQLAGR